MVPPDQPKCVVFGGPNGAGKSTIAEKILPALSIKEFVNADIIAKGLSKAPDRTVHIEASRLMLSRLEELAKTQVSFAFESTLSSRTHAVRLQQFKEIGYRIELFFIWLPSVELALERVRQRVLKGGHDIPEETVRRRYSRTIHNLFEIYLPLMDSCRIYDNRNMGAQELVARIQSRQIEVFEPHLWREFFNARSHEFH